MVFVPPRAGRDALNLPPGTRYYCPPHASSTREQALNPLRSCARGLCAVALLAASTAAWTAPAEPREYLRGYVDALLASRFPGLGLKVRRIAPDGVVTLSADACLGLRQRRDVERLIAKTGRVRILVWDQSADCDRPAPSQEPPEEAGLDIYFLPERELFAPLLADPRQPRFSMSYQRYSSAIREFAAASVAFGEYFGFASGFLDDFGGSQFGVQAAVFAVFNLDAPSSDLVNADYWVGLPLSYRRGPWSFLARVYHQSSHLGDEFILGNPGVNRVNLSYEDFEALVSYEWERWRLYGGGGYLLSSEPDLAPRHLHGGAEYLAPHALRELDFIAAADVRASAELDWRSSLSLQAGLEFKNASQRRLRLMFEHYDGYSPNGQFYRERLRYDGVGLYFGF